MRAGEVQCRSGRGIGNFLLRDEEAILDISDSCRRHFAVVAQEARELAQRSAKAIKEIKALIGTSGEHVERGVRLVGETGTSLRQIVDEV